jgi:hypothetical protein
MAPGNVDENGVGLHLQRIDDELRQFTPEGDDMLSHVGFPF